MKVLCSAFSPVVCFGELSAYDCSAVLVYRKGLRSLKGVFGCLSSVWAGVAPLKGVKRVDKRKHLALDRELR